MRKFLLIAIVLISMTGSAAATDIDLFNVGGPYDLAGKVTEMNLYPDGTTWTQKEIGAAFASGDAGSTHILTDTVLPMVGGGNPGDITIEYQEAGNSRTTGPYSWTQDVGTFEIIPVYFQAASGVPNGNTYLITISDSAGTVPYTAELTVTATMVPEFPTIALPVAAILGLAFIFQRRREED